MEDSYSFVIIEFSRVDRERDGLLGESCERQLGAGAVVCMLTGDAWTFKFVRRCIGEVFPFNNSFSDRCSERWAVYQKVGGLLVAKRIIIKKNIVTDGGENYVDASAVTPPSLSWEQRCRDDATVSLLNPACIGDVHLLSLFSKSW